jgi:hypothetical protein
MPERARPVESSWSSEFSEECPHRRRRGRRNLETNGRFSRSCRRPSAPPGWPAMSRRLGRSSRFRWSWGDRAGCADDGAGASWRRPLPRQPLASPLHLKPSEVRSEPIGSLATSTTGLHFGDQHARVFRGAVVSAVLSSRIGRRRSPGKVSRGRPGPEAPERGKDSIQSHVHVLPAVSRRRRDYLKTRTAVALAVSVAALAAPKVLAERGCGCPSSRSAGAAHRSSRRRA